jgi:eukaryotic-like serine/threonine-protein kinase
VVHRDLKPGNIMLTPQSGVKVLDFGLAKSSVGAVAAAAEGRGVGEDAPTQSSPLTAEGTIVGTFQYMAPEQLQGKEADARSDIFSFGAVLYEMATGKKAFAGKSQYSVASAILERDPEPMAAVQPMTPPALERLVKRCLVKDREERWQTAHDLAVELKWIAEAGSQAGVPARVVSRRKVREKVFLGLAVAGFLLAAAFAIAYVRQTSAPVRPTRSLILPPEKATFAFSEEEGGPVLSPDGTRLVFPARDTSGKETLWVRPLDSLSAQRLEGTEGASYPFWAPDSRTIGFFAGEKLKRIEATGGPAQTICDAPNGRGGAWNEHDVIVFAADWVSGLSRVPAAGGVPVQVTHLGQSQAVISSHRWPTFLPDGRHFLFWGGNLYARDEAKNGILIGALDSTETKFLVQADSNALYAPPGYLLYLRGETLMAQPFDAGSLELKGQAVHVAEHVPEEWGLALFAVSRTGLLAYQTAQGGGSSQFLWVDAHGNKLGTVGEPGDQGYLALSPDGAHLAYAMRDPQSKSLDIWVIDLLRGVRTRFTFDPADDNGAAWSPDGGRVVFGSNQKVHYDLYVKNASGAASEELLYESNTEKWPDDWSRDGRFIVFDSLDTKGKTGHDIWVLPLFGDRKPFPYLQTEFDEGAATFSPDGHWLAYQSDETGRFEVYLAPFPAASGKWQVSQGGGIQPAWNRDGRSLFYLAPAGKLMEASVRTKGSAVEIGVPRQLFQIESIPSSPYDRAYTVAPDRQRFLVNTLLQSGAPEPLTLVTNWTAGLK